jgi:CRISPR/Cas system CSM-associated protein Csm3 (group 7 of RAMP superfamily)
MPAAFLHWEKNAKGFYVEIYLSADGTDTTKLANKKVNYNCVAQTVWSKPSPAKVEYTTLSGNVSKVFLPGEAPVSLNFHNPYNFVPALPIEANGPLSFAHPVGHEAYFDVHFTGEIEIEIEVKTPLLLPDTSRSEWTQRGHQTTTTLEGCPLKPTALKGPLRAAYEAITNSRFGVFGGNNDIYSRGSYRGPKTIDPKVPSDLLADSLKPAQNLAQFSPADRIFGWVNKKADAAAPGRNAYKGQLRIASVVCTPLLHEEVLNNSSIPLAILAGPRTKQSRFYGAKDKSGTPISNGIDANLVGYGHTNVQGLRGRKFYLHQPNWSQGANAAWRSSDRDNQNRSIKDWVKPGTKFTAKIQVTNLNEAELGALLWLLNLGSDGNHFLKIGGGKPLGFGSVKVTVKNLDLRDGAALRADFKMLTGKATAGKRLTNSTVAIACFQSELTKLYCNGIAQTFDEIRFIKAFKRACTGPEGNDPIQYPTLQTSNNIYEWFGANDGGKKLALPALWDLKPLPRNPA